MTGVQTCALPISGKVIGSTKATGKSGEHILVDIPTTEGTYSKLALRIGSAAPQPAGEATTEVVLYEITFKRCGP